MSFFGDFAQDDIEIVAPDGTVRHQTKAIVTDKGITIPDGSIVIQPGDEIRRRIPSGVEERFEVVDPVYYENSGDIPAYYQVEARKMGVSRSRRGGNNYNVHVSGQNARANFGSHDRSTNVATQGDVFGDIAAILQGTVKDADELQQLLAAVEKMKCERGGAGFAAAYRSFVAL